MKHGSLSIRDTAMKLRHRLTEIRRDFHTHPELAMQEHRTAERVADFLDEAGLEITTGVAGTGVVGLLRGAREGATLALRVDMDALPLQEANDCAYRSRNDGVMHACGHDGHMAIGLGAAMLLSEHQAHLPGNVKFLFQPAEEVISGAPLMIREGVLKNPDVTAGIGIHLWPGLPLGTVGLSEGPIMAGANHFHITLRGQGGHGAQPHLARDPLVAANQICQTFQTLRRNVNALEPYVLSVCAIHGGSTYNIVPHEAEIRGTLRTFDPQIRKMIMQRMQTVVSGIAQACEVDCALSFDIECPPVVNSPHMVNLAREACACLELSTAECEPSMGSEDFAFFAERMPAVYLKLGTRQGAALRSLHSNTFDFDESVLPLGAALMAQCVLAFTGGTCDGRKAGTDDPACD